MKWAVVTGSSSGLGLAMAQHLLKLGWNVAGGARTPTPIEHENFFDLELDVRDEKAVHEFYQTLKDLTPEIDLFVQNAGVCEMAALDETAVQSFEDHLLTNTAGAFLMLKGLRPFVKPNETQLVSVLSTAAKIGYPGMGAYSASQFAQRGMLEALQKEWKNLRLRFSTLYAGAVDTPLWKDLGAHQYREKMLSIEEFLYVFDFILRAPSNLRVSELTFLHRQGFLE